MLGIFLNELSSMFYYISTIYCILLIGHKKRGSLPAEHSLQEAGGGGGQVDEREGHRRAARWRRRRRGSRRKYLGLARPGRPLAVAELAPGDQIFLHLCLSKNCRGLCSSVD